MRKIPDEQIKAIQERQKNFVTSWTRPIAVLSHTLTAAIGALA